jgi:hypothetical protein
LKTLLRKYSFAITVSTLGLCAAAGMLWQTAQAQSDGWTQPQLIFEGRGLINAPTLVADAYGQVHAFWLFQADTVNNSQQQYVYYTRLDQPTWPVNDIFVEQSGGATLKAAMTRTGLGIMWAGNNFASSGISPAASAQVWSGPLQVDSGYSESGLAVAPDGSLWTIYGSTATNEIFVQHLNPDTGNWDAPLLVGTSINIGAAPDGTRLAISADGTMHAVWAEYQLPNGWPPVGLYYTQSTDGGKTWSGRHKIAGSNFNQPNVIVGSGQQVYVAWTGTAGTGMKYFQDSQDEGRTWQNQVTVMNQPGGGSEGAPNLAVDSAGNVHMVFSHNGCAWHAVRENNTWSAPECLSAGVAANASIESPAMALGLGNQLHVLFWTDRHQLWYTKVTLPIPGQAPLPTPTLAVPTATVPVPTLTPLPSQTPLPDYGPAARPEQATDPSVWALVSGIVPVVFLALIVAIFRRPFRR